MTNTTFPPMKIISFSLERSGFSSSFSFLSVVTFIIASEPVLFIKYLYIAEMLNWCYPLWVLQPSGAGGDTETMKRALIDSTECNWSERYSKQISRRGLLVCFFLIFLKFCFVFLEEGSRLNKFGNFYARLFLQKAAVFIEDCSFGQYYGYF